MTDILGYLEDLKIRYRNLKTSFRKNHQSFGICATSFTININKLLANFQMQLIELQSSIQLEENFHHVSLLDFYKVYHVLFMSSLFGSASIYEVSYVQG